MTTEHSTRTPRPPDAELARIAAELRALGEPEFDAELEAEPIVALIRESAVPTAFALAHPPTAETQGIGLLALAPLSELDRQRVWRKVLSRRTGAAHASPRPPSWRATWVAVATAAGLALVPMLSPGGSHSESTPAARAAAAALGTEARAALEAVPGEQDTGRATQLAALYAARLADADSGAEAVR
jgi:hypothetical protein